MQLDILSPEKRVFSGKVYGIMLPGVEGSFEMLDHHAPIIAALGKGKMKVIKEKKPDLNASGNTEMYEISGGFVEMLNNNASVLVEDAKLV
jgi:F-type H+-transporting ATPase subunit epsilon